MTSREIITRVIERKDALRIGFSLNSPYQNDIWWTSIGNFVNSYAQYRK